MKLILRTYYNIKYDCIEAIPMIGAFFALMIPPIGFIKSYFDAFMNDRIEVEIQQLQCFPEDSDINRPI